MLPKAQLRKRHLTAFLPCAFVAIVVSACEGSPDYRPPTAPTIPNVARVFTGSTTIQSIDDLLAQCASSSVTPGARESVTVHLNPSPYGYAFWIAFGSRFSIEMGLGAQVDGETIRAEAVPVVFYYDDAPYFDCRNGRPVERVWVYGGRFSGVSVGDRIEGTLEILYRTGPSNLDPGSIASSYERLELVLTDERYLG